MRLLTLTKYCIIFACMMFMQNTQAQKLPPDNPNYQLVFSDDFDSLGVDTAHKWHIGYPWGIVDYWGLFPNGDTMFIKYICPENDASLFQYHTDSSYIRLPFTPDTSGFPCRVVDYNTIVLNNVITNVILQTPYVHANDTIIHIETVNYSGDWIDLLETDSVFFSNTLTIKEIKYYRVFKRTDKQYFYKTPLLWSKHSYRYGYFEIRTRMQYLDQNHNNQGGGPAFWLFNSTSTVPHSEMDIYEIKDISPEDDLTYNISLDTDSSMGHYKHDHTTSIHFQDSIMKLSDITHHDHAVFGSVLFCQTCFKTFSAFWDKQSIQYYRDDTLIRTSHFYTDKMSDMFITFSNNDPTWVYDSIHDYFFPILPDRVTSFPYNYDVDYVRVYQLKLHCDSDCTVSSFNPDTFGYGLYRNLTISSGTSVIASGKNVEIMATDGITINGDFTVQSGAELLIETKPCQEEQNQTKSDMDGLKTLPPNFYQRFMH